MSDDILNKIHDLCKISDGVNNYIQEGKFIDPTEEHSIEFPEIIINCKRIIIAELEELGIRCVDEEMNLTDGYRGDVVIHLLELFQPYKVREFIKRLDEEELELFKNLLKVREEVDAEFGLELIITFILNFNPSNEKLELIKYYAFDYVVDDLFYDNLNDVINNTVKYTEESMEFNIDLVNYLRYKLDHIRKVKKAALAFKAMKFDTELNELELVSRISIHDYDLINGDTLKEMTTLWKIENSPNPNKENLELLEEKENRHHLTVKHHLESFVGKEEEMTLVDDIDIVSDIYDEQESKIEYLNQVRKVFSPINVSNSTKDRLIMLANRLNLW